MIVYVRLTYFFPNMDKNVITTCSGIASMSFEQLRHKMIGYRRIIRYPLDTSQPLPEHTARSADRGKWIISISHEHTVMNINKVDCTEHGISEHRVMQHVLLRHPCLGSNGGRS